MRGPVDPQQPPFLGPAARLLGDTSLAAIAALLHAGPPTQRTSIAGADYLVSADPEVIRRVLVDRADNYVKDTRLMAPFLGLLGEGLLTSEGPLWRRERGLLAPAFHSEALRVVADAAHRAVARASARLDEHADRGEAVDLGAWSRRYTLQVVAGAALSLAPEVCDEALAHLYEPIVAEANRRVWLPLRAALPLPGGDRHDRALQALVQLLRAHVGARRGQGPGDGDMLDLLIAADVDDRQICDELRTMLFAGHETTSAALVWTLHALMGQPAWFERLRVEADEVLAGGPPGLAELRRLDLAGACFKEALRLYSVVPVATRRALAADTLADLPVAAGDLVLLHLQALHHDPRHWDAPAEFRPQRFVGAPPGPTRSWLPFLVGPRSCIGQNFALITARVALAQLARRYDLTPDPGNRGERHRFNIPTGPAGKIAAVVTRRG